MPNSYTVVPNILPGNVTIGGILTVQGDFIRIGAASPFARVGKSTTGGAILNYNLANDQVTRDGGAASAVGLELLRLANRYAQLNMYNSAGSLQGGVLAATIAQSGVTTTNTGNTIENTMLSATIRANMLGIAGGFALEWHLVGTAQGAVATTFRVKFGATVIIFTTQTATGSFTILVEVFNRNATNSQQFISRKLNETTGATAVLSTGGEDTTVDKTLTVTIQNGAGTDSWDSRGWQVYSLVSQTAVL